MSWRTVNLGQLVDNFSVRAKDHPAVTSELEFCGVSNEDGITKSKFAAEHKADDYKIIEKDCFAYNPYRINVGSIGLLEDDTVGLISPAYVVFKPKPRSIIPQLLLKFLKSAEGLRQIKMYARGTVRQALRFEDLCKIEIAIPDYDEQVEFFKRISETETESNILSTELTHQLDLVKQLRQAFLREAMQGKLVPQDPNDDPASELLEKIKAEKERLIKEKKIKKQKPLPPITEEEIPFDIPENWVWCKIDSLVFDLNSDLRTGPFGTALNKSEHKKDGVPVWGIESISKSGQFTNSNKIFVDEVKAHELRSFEVLGGDLIISRSGTIAELCMIPFETKKGLLSTNLMKISLNHSVMMPEIFCHIIKGSTYIKESLKEMCSGSTRLFLTQKILKQLVFPLPPLSEQQRIVTKLDELMGYCDELEASIKESQQQNELLLQQVLREALEPKEKEVEKV